MENAGQLRELFRVQRALSERVALHTEDHEFSKHL
jgi:hypothetical protein